MLHVRPKIRGLEHKELIWAKQFPGSTRVALPVNADELTDSLVMRFKPTWIERLKVLFGQDLFIWFAANGQVPQWPMPYLSTPVYTRLEFSDGSPFKMKTLPENPKKFFAMKEKMSKARETVPNPHSDMDMLAPDIETELNRTVREKINERAAR